MNGRPSREVEEFVLYAEGVSARYEADRSFTDLILAHAREVPRFRPPTKVPPIDRNRMLSAYVDDPSDALMVGVNLIAIARVTVQRRRRPA